MVGADVETAEGVDAMMRQAMAVQGSIDVAIHNVGGTIWTKPFWEYDVPEIEREVRRSFGRPCCARGRWFR